MRKAANARGVWIIGFVAIGATFRPGAAHADAAAATAGLKNHYLSLTQLDAYLEFRSEFSSVEVETNRHRGIRSQRSQSNRNWGAEERLGLKLGGAVFDPSLITFGGDVAFGLTQDRFEEHSNAFDRTDEDQGSLLLYNLRADFFRGSRISGSVYGLRQDDRINRRFQPTLDQTRTGFGTTWVFSDAKFPMELSYDYLETDRTGNTERADDEHFLESTLHYGGEWNIDEHHRIKFAFEHAETKQDYQGSPRSFETTRDLVTVEHELEFGPGAGHSLRTLMHWQEESGDFARDFFRIGPQLTLKHDDQLQTIYKYQANRELYGGFDVETHRADFQLIHQLYTNLTSTVGVFGQTENLDQRMKTDQYGGSVDWAYNRKNSYGQFYANLALAYDTENASDDQGTRIVLDEAQAFRDPLDVTLRNRNVIPQTVIVTDSANRRVYRRGADYLLAQWGTVVRLIRMPSGRIADGDTVLVDYSYRTPADGQLDTIRTDFTVEQRFSNGWTPYYRLSYRNQEDQPSIGFARRADRTDHHRFGVRYDGKTYSAGAEYEIFDDTIEPYDAYHLHALLRLVQRSDHSANLTARFSQFFFEGGIDRRDVIFVDLELDHRWRFSDRWSTLGRLAYRFENDSSDGVTHGVDVSAGLEYVVGDLSGELTFDYDRLALPVSEEDDFGIYLRVRREFPRLFGIGN